jgi:hypothetical protein
MPNRDRHLADRDMCARPPAGRPELWWHGGQVPANRLAAALPAQHVPLFLQPSAGTGPALPVPAERAAGLRTVSRAAIAGNSRSSARPSSSPGGPAVPMLGIYPVTDASSPLRPGTGTSALAARPAAHTAALRDFTILVGSSAGGAYPADRRWVASARSCLIRDPRICLISQARAAVLKRFAWPPLAGRGPSPGRRGLGRGW